MKYTYLLIPLLLIAISCQKNLLKKDRMSFKPNIILIYADDLGIGLLGHEGQEIIKTPHIDKLAKEGIRFQRAYSNMLCAPARASLLTGLHDCHEKSFQITNASEYIHANESNVDDIQKSINDKLRPISEKEIFLGKVAQQQGYKTAQFGKLEWGFSTTDNQMQKHGWDYYIGYLDHVRAHGFYPPFLFENGKIKEIKGNTKLDCAKTGEPETPEIFQERWNMEGKQVYSQDLFMEGIFTFLEENKDNPFFLYFPTQLPHGPVSIPKVHPDFKDDVRLTQIEKEYASMVKLLDDNVGQIMLKLKELHLDENTIVIFTADNGHEIYYSKEGRIHKPYTNIKTGKRFDDYNRKYYSNLSGDVFNGNGGRAGLKRSNLEGGINVPLIIRWPNQIKEGQVSNRLTPNYDILPTIAEIVGDTNNYEIDGYSFYDELILNSSNNQHDFIVYSSFQGPTLITNDGWKLRAFYPKDSFELYNLFNDKREERNLANKYPEKFEQLKNILLEACDGEIENGVYLNKKMK